MGSRVVPFGPRYNGITFLILLFMFVTFQRIYDTRPPQSWCGSLRVVVSRWSVGGTKPDADSQ